MENIRSTLDKLASQSDSRTSVFDIEIVRLQNSNLTLSGRLLDESQLETLSQHFSNWNLDTSAIEILHKANLPRMHVTTNVTGLYEKPTFYMPLSSELCYGTEVEILDEQGNWVFTRQNDGYLGWLYKPYLGEGTIVQATHLVVAPSCELRVAPDPASEVLTRLVSGTSVRADETRGDWVKITANKTGWLPASLLRSLNKLPASLEERRKTLVEDAKQMIGVPYLWGGTTGNGIDCSGFVRLLHHWIGIEIQRDADMHHTTANPVKTPFEVGDLLFFADSSAERKITHVAMSLGGWTIIHSSRPHNGVYIEDVQKNESRMETFVGGSSFLR